MSERPVPVRQELLPFAAELSGAQVLLPPFRPLGYFLHPAARGRGAATEAVRLVTDWAFAALRARRVWASCDRANERSWRLLERCGFRREGHLVNGRVGAQGRLRDTLICAVTR